MTAAHSAGTAVFSSLRQLATMASRSMVRMPGAVTVAAASAAAAFASGDSRSAAVTDFRSEAAAMPDPTRRHAVVQPCKAMSVRPLRQVALIGEIAKSRELAFEMQFDHAGRSVTLLADDDFGLAVDQRHVELPFFVFRRTRSRLLVGEVVFLAIDKHHDVGV